MFSDDGRCVHDPLIMRRALEYTRSFGGLIAQHAEEPRLTVGAQAHEGANAARLGLAGWPAAAEESIVARDCLLAGHTGGRLHICHVSTAGTAEILRWWKARQEPGEVSAEVTPHHLL
ncbi:dihydroorotase, partial [Klebsiella pneumoniae]|nr:dihydroorotase [Klebsiella pneumoniae]